jgi:transposase
MSNGFHPGWRWPMTFESSIELDGVNTGIAKLTIPQVLEIKRRLEEGLDFYHEIASDYGVSPHTIRNIKKGLSWAWLKSEDSPSPQKRRKLNADQVIQIRKRLKSGESYQTLSWSERRSSR